MKLYWYIPYFLIMCAYDIMHWRTMRGADILKPLLMPSLIMGYMAATGGGNVLIILGLAFGFLGDVALMLPSNSPKQLPLLCGIAAFLLGHIMYAIWCVRAVHTLNGRAFAFLPIAVFAGYFLFKYLKPGIGNMLLPVLAYEVVILGMSACALILLMSRPCPGSALVWLGSLIFIVSDSFLAERMFLRARPHSGFIVSITYTVAQLLIALGAALVGK